MRSRRRTHHSHVAWSGSDEEFQAQTPQPAWDAAWGRVRAERKQAGLPNTYIHRAATFFSKYSYNFCWPVRTLKARGGETQTPAMMAKLTDHVWTLAEWIKRPAIQLA